MFRNCSISGISIRGHSRTREIDLVVRAVMSWVEDLTESEKLWAF